MIDHVLSWKLALFVDDWNDLVGVILKLKRFDDANVDFTVKLGFLYIVGNQLKEGYDK